MRKRDEIEDDGARLDIKALEVLLDIRELLTPKVPKQERVAKKKRSPKHGTAP